jgi:DNA (cytosine-5)-methyltransferase 1
VVPDSEVPEQFFIAPDKLERWEYLKGPKKEPRKTRAGFTYNYSEGGMAFPDPLDRPARTILTGEGGSGASRMKHVDGWAIPAGCAAWSPTSSTRSRCSRGAGPASEGDGKEMSDGHRAFCMGNALVVGIPHRIGEEIARRRE